MGILPILFGSPKKGRTSLGSRGATNSRVAAQKGAAGARCLELHGSVHTAPDDLAEYTKLASRVGLLIRFSYVDQTGSLTSRAVTIDGIFGASLDDPQYLIGLC